MENLTWCFLSCFLCRNLFLLVAVFTLTLPTEDKMKKSFKYRSLRKFGLSCHIPYNWSQLVSPLVSLSSWPLLLCFPCLCDLFCCLRAPGRWDCCTSAAILSKIHTCFPNRKFWFFRNLSGLAIRDVSVWNGRRGKTSSKWCTQSGKATCFARNNRRNVTSQ